MSRGNSREATPEAYIAAIKARPYVTWISTHYYSGVFRSEWVKL
jgi:hypothetical protein